MIKNYKIFTESLLNKLSGPSEEEIKSNLLNRYNSGEITFSKFSEKMNEIDLKISYEIIEDAFINGRLSFYGFLFNCDIHKTKRLNDDEIFDLLINKRKTKLTPVGVLSESIKAGFKKGIYYGIENYANPNSLSFIEFRNLLVRLKSYDDYDTIFKLLKDYKNDIEKKFLFSAMYGYIEGIKHCMEIYDIVEVEDYRVFSLAIKNNHLNVIEEIINSEENGDGDSDRYVKNAIKKAQELDRNDLVEVIENMKK